MYWRHRDEFGAPQELARKRVYSSELSARIGSETRVKFGALRKNRLRSENTVRSSPKESARKQEGSRIGCIHCKWGEQREHLVRSSRMRKISVHNLTHYSAIDGMVMELLIKVPNG